MAKTRSPSPKSHPPKNVLTDADERLVGTREILARFLPVHRSTLNEMIAEGRFPKPLKLGKSKLFWRWSAILKWLDERERHPVKRREFRNPHEWLEEREKHPV
jgi:prophage regulatory protein